MNRLDFRCDDWFADENAPYKSVTRMTLPDYRGEEKDCWHLRGRCWRWTTLKFLYPKLTAGEDYELCFWAKFDYYSESGVQCFIDLLNCDDWAKRYHFDITPNSPNAVANSGDWVLYKYSFRAMSGKELYAQIIAFDANIAIMQANPEDEMNPCITTLLYKADNAPFSVDNELPFKEYASLEQRMVKFHSDLLAPFYPCKDISEASQREYYDFVNGIYDRLFTTPEGYFTKLYEDDAHPNRFNNASYGKPKLKLHMKSDQDKIVELFELLMSIGSTSVVEEGNIHIGNEISKKQLKLLAYMGFSVDNGYLIHEKYEKIGDVIKYLSEKEKALYSLMYCWFDNSYPYLEKTFIKQYDKEQYERLTNWLHENGYQISVGSGLDMMLDYHKSICKKDTPVGYAIHGDKNHYGFTFEFRFASRVMAHCEPRIIQYSEMLKHFDELSEDTKSLILVRTKRCDECRYCVQTDKTGNRPFAALKVGEGTVLCPYYPGFNFVFERLLKQEVDSIISFLTDLERLITV